MIGLIWLVQVVQYPGFRAVGPREWPAYHAAHSNTITRIIAPMMFTELLLAVLLVFAAVTSNTQNNQPIPTGVGPLALSPIVLSLAGILCLIFAWGVTFLISVPLHQRLSAGHDHALIVKLVSTNWFRTIAWSLRGLIALAMVLGSNS